MDTKCNQNSTEKTEAMGDQNSVELASSKQTAPFQEGPGMTSSKFLLGIVKLAEESGLLAYGPAKNKVVCFEHPDKLQNLVDISLGEAPTNDTQLLELCRKIVAYSVKTNHPHFYNQLFHAPDLYGLAGTWLTECLNTSQYTFEVGPVFTLIEMEVLKQVLSMVGFTDGDGIFAPGGSMSNMYGMVAARYKFFPEVKLNGIFGSKPLAVFTSEESHYSIVKCANWLGIGMANVYKVKVDDRGRMIPNALEDCIDAAIAQGKIPFFVNATAASTVLGAFDPIESIADICHRRCLWLHIDACLGMPVLLAKKHRHLLKGIERAQSVALDFHKVLGAPLQCSAFLVAEKGLLHNCNSASATYLFQQDKFYDVSYDTGDKSVQCGRKVDAFKFWLMWKARGSNGLESFINNAFACAQYFAEYISKRDGFRLVLPTYEFTNVSFWYIPKHLRGREETSEWWNEVGKVAPKVKEQLVLKGSMLIGYQPLPYVPLVNFFRLAVACFPPSTTQDMEFVASEIEAVAQSLFK